MLGSLQAQLIALGIAAVVAFGAGWKTRDAFCDAAEAKARVATLQRQLDATQAALKGDQELAAQDAKAKEQLQEKVRELEGKISEGECFSADDVERIRGLWLRK